MFSQVLLAAIASALSLVAAGTSTSAKFGDTVSHVADSLYGSVSREGYNSAKVKFKSTVSGQVEKKSGLSYGATDRKIVDKGLCGKNVEYEVDDRGLLTINGTGEMDYQGTGFFVPTWSCVHTYRDLFLKKVVIHEGVTSIGNYAFEGCRGLLSVEIPNSVTKIGKNAFGNCSNLTLIEIPSAVSSIGCGAFYGCSNLSHVIYRGSNQPENCQTDVCQKTFEIDTVVGVPSVYREKYELFDPSKTSDYFCGMNTANYHSGLCGENVWYVLHEGVLIIYGKGDMYNSLATAFTPWDKYRSDIEKVIIKNGVTSVSGYAFSECNNLTSVEISSGVTTIGNAAFKDCKKLKAIDIPDSVTYIGNYAFKDSALSSINIPSSVKSIGNGAFLNCRNLENIIIPSGVTTIEDYTFSGCSSLTSVEIAGDVDSIHDYAFKDCGKLESVKLKGDKKPKCGKEAFKNCGSLTMDKTTMCSQDDKI